MILKNNVFFSKIYNLMKLLGILILTSLKTFSFIRYIKSIYDYSDFKIITLNVLGVNK